MKLRDALGVSLISGFLGALTMLFWKEIPPKNEQLIVYMLGQLSGFAAAIVGFHYTRAAGEKELEEKRAENTRAAFEAITAAAATPGAPIVKTEIGDINVGDKP